MSKTKMVKRFETKMSKTQLGVGGLVTGSLMGVLAVVETICRVELIVTFLGVTPLAIYFGVTTTVLTFLIVGLMFAKPSSQKHE
ncbi:MAG: hypothetical protein WAQ98_13570 [Blastocatellia bacterium]|jgi:hypothetical protein